MSVAPSRCTLTHVGAATVLIDVGGLRILTDPTFDPAGSTYKVGPLGLAQQTRVQAPALPAEAMQPVDVVLLTHDAHADNLDTEGRTLLSTVQRVITTPQAAERLGDELGSRVVGLRSWQSLQLLAPSGRTVTVTAVPARHGPPLAERLTGTVTGFVLEWPDQPDGALYVSGDTRLYEGLRAVAERFRVGVALLHLGAARLGLAGALRSTMTAAEAVEATRVLEAHTIIPVHYEGWSHFEEGRADVEHAFTEAGLHHHLCWLTPGVSTHLVQ
ncbi:MAG: MBL fold metallo-hydrolase [Bacteroidota bacterium]